MHLSRPVPRGLRVLYALHADRLWFALAVLGSLILASELVEAMWFAAPVIVQGIGF